MKPDTFVRLVRPYVFQASHMGLFGKEGELQHDTFTVEVHVGIERAKMRSGTVIPIHELDVCVLPVVNRVREKRLDLLDASFEPMASAPTAENVALYFFDSLQFLGNSGRQRFLGVRVHEGCSTWSAEVWA